MRPANRKVVVGARTAELVNAGDHRLVGLELGRAAKVNGNIQTPSLVIEQGAVFEGNCKMAKMSAAVGEKAREEKAQEARPLDTSGIKPAAVTAGAVATGVAASKPSDISGLAAKPAEVSPASKMAN